MVSPWQHLQGAILLFPLVASSKLNVYKTFHEDVQQFNVNLLVNGQENNIETQISTFLNNSNDEAFEEGNRELCRQFPMWTTSSEHDDDFDWMCRTSMKYDPTSVELLVEEEEVRNYRYYDAWSEQGRSCLLWGIDQANRNKTADDETPIKRAKIETVYKNSGGLPVMVVVSNALSEEEALVLRQLSMCTRMDDPSNLQHRPFYDSDDNIKGGNDVVFLGGYLQLLTPGIAARVQEVTKMAWEHAGWKDILKESGEEEYQDPALCGIRTSEHLSYDNWGGLGPHADSGSLYTTLIALSSPSDYDGGEFYIYPNSDDEVFSTEERIGIRPERLSALIFLSEKSHGVEDIYSEGREMFATEHWKHGDSFIGTKRPRASDLLEFQKLD